jgi:cellulose synthase/poly-beta-1,6-N-acetylglucosamine synthase-like glycosyltransferase
MSAEEAMLVRGRKDLNASPFVSVVIPAYNSMSTIGKVVRGCFAQNYPRDKFEVIVVDDGSTDATKEIVQASPARYICQENAGPAKARNTGWKAAAGEIIFFTDSDCIPEEAWLSKMVAHYTDEAVGGVGGSYDIANKDNWLASCIHEEIVQRHLKMPENVDYLGSFNLSYRKKVLEEVGGFDESYRMASGEDNDLAYRVKKRGYKLVFDREAKVAHYHPSHLCKYLRQQFWHGYWRMKIYSDHHDMIGGDAYGGMFDFIQPPLSLFTLALLPLLFFPMVRYLVFALIAAQMMLQFRLPFAVIRRTGQWGYLALAAATYLRGHARGLGMTLGIWKFFIRPKLNWVG